MSGNPTANGRPSTNIAVVGCGYAADLYLATMPNYPELSITGVCDRDPDRAAALASHYSLPRYPDLDAVLADDRVDLVLNLTSPASHADVSSRALRADKHVYSEKPIATVYEEGMELVALAERRGLVFGAAPCNLLGEAAQTVWRAVRSGAIGRPRLVYAELDDGPLHQMPYRRWRSASGSPWPYRSELQTGCILEHSGYYLTWLIAMFGPVAEMSTFVATLGPPVPEVDELAPDFGSSCLRFRSGVVARLTCSVIAPTDHSLRIVGEQGILTVADGWHFGAKVYHRRTGQPRYPYLSEDVAYPLVRRSRFTHDTSTHGKDFARGVAEVARAARERRPSRLSGRHALHALDLMLSMSEGRSRTFDTDLDPVAPMPWACDRDEPPRGTWAWDDA